MDVEKLNRWAKEIHDNATAHGWHEEKHSPEHYLGLIMTEVAEAVEADRKGYSHYIKKIIPKLVEEEIWHPVVGESDYEVSTFGRVRSKDMKVWNGKVFYVKKGRILKLAIVGNGYLGCALHGKTHKVSTLVAEAFLVKKNEKDVVNHIDGDKKNNNLGNLEYVSYSDNLKHAIITGLNKRPHILTYEQKVEIAFKRKSGETWWQISNEKEWGVTKSAIKRVCKEYKKYTDSVEFEFSDIVIRLLDMAVELYGDFKYSDFPLYRKIGPCETLSLAENLWFFVKYKLYCYHPLISEAIVFIYDFSEQLGINLDQHIEWKMKYNESRPYKHGGKKY